MDNPIVAYMMTKTAGPLDGVSRMAGNVGRKALDEIPKGIGAGVAALGVGAATAAVQKIHDALTKRRDFRSMLEHNPHLQEAQTQDPKRFNQLYSTLRTFNPEFSADPIVAGTYMDRMWQNPAGAGAIATEALQARDKIPHPVQELFHAGVVKGLGSKNESGGGGDGAQAGGGPPGGPGGAPSGSWNSGNVPRSGGFVGAPPGGGSYNKAQPRIVPLGGGMNFHSWKSP